MKTINGDVSNQQVKAFVQDVRIISHQADFTVFALYKAVKNLLEIHGLDQKEIEYLSKGEWR
jgi:hypothetical protein